MQLKLFNTLGRKLEAFLPADKLEVRLYTCGPTVYNFVHIGNLRAYISADILKRALSFEGQDINWVMNITDVDDKTIANTIKESGEKSRVPELIKFTDKYLGIFLDDLKKVNIEQQDINFVRVTEKIADIQLYILKLMDLGFAYKADDGSTYFSIQKYQEKFGDYGVLVGAKFLEGKKIGARVKVDEYEKDDLSDFALWKAHGTDDGQIYWEHPILGKGRPGWHIECTLINYMKFPEGTDIHTGGVDLVFPHHTNEIAQANPVYNPKDFVRYWIHSEHIQVENKKMSKSAGNFWTLEELEKDGISGLDLRYLILQSNYGTKLNITKESLEAAKNGLRKLRIELGSVSSDKSAGKQTKAADEKDYIQEFTNLFEKAIGDNLNTSEALAVLQKVLRSEDLNTSDKLRLAYRFDEVLGLDLENTMIVADAEDTPLPVEVQKLKNQRDKARATKDYELSDTLRKQIEDLGFEVKDKDSESLIIKKY